MPTIASSAVPDERSLTIGGIVVLTLGALDFGIEQSIIVPALPALAAHYEASLIAIGWLATGFLLASIVAVPLFGRMADLFGKRRLLLIALSAFAVGSLICALTDSIGLAIAGRVIQGLGAAVPPLTMALARDTLPPELLSRAIGGVVGAAMAGSGIGFLLSGILVDHFSPAAIFWFLFGFGVLLVLAVLVFVQESPVRTRVPLDLGGAGLLAVGLVALLLAISKGNAWDWSSPRILGLFAAAGGVLVAFVLVERHVRQPLVDLGLVVARPFSQTNVCVAAFGFAFFIAVFLVPQIAAAPDETGYGLGLSTLGVGVLQLPTSLAAFATGWAGGRMVDRLGPRALAVSGCVLGVGGYTSLALAHDGWFELSAGSALIGAAWGLILTAIYPVVVRGASTDKTGVAIGVNVVVRNTSVAVGTQSAFAIVAGAGLVGGFTADVGFTRAFVLGACGAVVALLASTLMPGRERAPAAG